MLKKRKCILYRRNSGETSFNRFFSSFDCAVVKAPNYRIKFHIYVDRSSIEVFANKGEIAMTSLIFPDSLSKSLELFSIGGNVKLLSLEVYRLKSICSSSIEIRNFYWIGLDRWTVNESIFLSSGLVRPP